MARDSDHAGLAALSICEALLLAMSERKLLPETEILGLLRDAATTHENAVATPGAPGSTEADAGAARLINRIMAGGTQASRL